MGDERGGTGGADSGGCKHYRRKCDVLAPCCQRYFCCHMCHDEHFAAHYADADACSVEMKGTTAGRAGRYLVEKVRCKLCALEQDVGASCAGCEAVFAEHFCAPCKLYSSAANGIFHCEDCGICRVGKRADYWHCEKCGSCYTVASRTTHKCVDRALESDCPICMEYLFTSAEPCFVGPHCGHAMHSSCFKQCLDSGKLKCPVCEAPLVDITPRAVVRNACAGLCGQLRQSLTSTNLVSLMVVCCAVWAAIYAKSALDTGARRGT